MRAAAISIAIAAISVAPVFAQRGGRGGGASFPRTWPSASWGRPWATASRQRRASRATPPLTMPAPRRAECGSPPTAARLDSRFSTASRLRRSARWRSRPPITKQVWAGTGEAWAIRDMRHDGRRHLQVDRRRARRGQHMGLDETGRIGRIVVHPTNPDIVFVCALGRTDRTAAGARRLSAPPTAARHWERVLFVDANTGCSGLTMDAARSAHAVRRHVAGGDAHLRRCSAAARRSGGVRFARWRQRTGRASKATACRNRRWARSTWRSRHTDSNRVYALIQTADQGSLWRSDDGGENWTRGKLAARA